MMNKKIYPILLVNFIGILGYSIIMPILIFLVEKLGGNAWMYGIVGSIYPTFQLFGSPLLGRLSDRIGRKKVLFLSQAGTLGAWILFLVALSTPTSIALFNYDSKLTGSFALTLPLLILCLARALDGFTGGNISVANAYLADVSTNKDKSENFGKMSASTSLGFVLGPALAGVLSTTALAEFLPVGMAAAISLITLVLIAKWLPESKADLQQDTSSENGLRRFFGLSHKDCSKAPKKQDTFRQLAAIPHIRRMLFLYFLTFLAFSLFYAGFPIHAANGLQWSVGELGFFLALSSVIMFVIDFYLLKRIEEFLTNKQMITIGSLMLGASFVLLTQENIVVLYTANVLLAIGNGIMWPSFMALLSKLSPDEKQGAIMGWGNSMGSLGSIFGLIAGGVLYENLQTWVFVIGGVIFLLISLIVLIFGKTEEATLEPV